MRRSAARPRFVGTAVETWSALALVTAAAGCADGVYRGLTQSPVCPRDAERDATGRCACAKEDVLVLGACVPAAVGDAFCGRGSRILADGCAFRPCADAEVMDLASGTCAPRAPLARGGPATCAEGAAPVLEGRQAVCVPLDATCPRGSWRVGAGCARPPRCPPGTLPDKSACRPVVTVGGRTTGRRVDVGAWTALALGIDGGAGSHELCRPLTQRPSAFGVLAGDTLALRIRVTIVAPDQDLSRLHATVWAAEAGGPDAGGRDGGGRELAPPALALVSESVNSLLEALRGLGGEASTAAVELEVRCTIGVP